MDLLLFEVLEAASLDATPWPQSIAQYIHVYAQLSLNSVIHFDWPDGLCRRDPRVPYEYIVWHRRSRAAWPGEARGEEDAREDAGRRAERMLKTESKRVERNLSTSIPSCLEVHAECGAGLS